MASRQRRGTTKRFGPNIVEVSGRFFPNGTATTALAVNTDGGVASVIRSGTAGTFTITFDDPYYSLIGCRLQVQHTTAADLVPQLGDVSNLGTSTACTAVVRVLAGATPTDITANANSSVFFSFTFQDSSVNRNVSAA